MRGVSLGSIGLIAFMGCTRPVAAQQTQSRPKPKRGATRALLLASTALATGIFAGAMVNPQTAQAQVQHCIFTQFVSPNNVVVMPRTFSWDLGLNFDVLTITTVTCDQNTTTTNSFPSEPS